MSLCGLGLHRHAGEAWVELHAHLGGPHQYHGFRQQPPPKRVSPSRERRRARRAAARNDKTAENDIIEENTTEEVVEKTNFTEAVEASDTVEDTNIVNEVEEVGRDNDAENASDDNSNELKKFSCEICDFSSMWENGLAIHMTKKHGNIEQLDGNADTEDDEKYDRTRYHWEVGTVGIAYCNYIDVIDMIENSDLKP